VLSDSVSVRNILNLKKDDIIMFIVVNYNDYFPTIEVLHKNMKFKIKFWQGEIYDCIKKHFKEIK